MLLLLQMPSLLTSYDQDSEINIDVVMIPYFTYRGVSRTRLGTYSMSSNIYMSSPLDCGVSYELVLDRLNHDQKVDSSIKRD